MTYTRTLTNNTLIYKEIGVPKVFVLCTSFENCRFTPPPKVSGFEHRRRMIIGADAENLTS